MKFNWKQILLLIVFTTITLFAGITASIVTGFSFGFTKSNNMRELLREKKPEIPTQILDKNGKLISELVGEQKRDIVYFHELPIEITTALISREDPKFFYHSGFSLKSTLRALVFLGKRGGGSTVSQQTAGVKFCDRSDISGKRKIQELWYSFNLERDLAKEEIIQLYLNEVYFGHGAYGIEAASQFFFHHSARKLTLAESAIIVTPISSPWYYSPIRNKNNIAGKRQKFVLERMTQLGYIDKDVADKAYSDFWINFDKNRSPQETYQDLTNSNNKALFFTDYIRDELNGILFGETDIYKDGYIIETTLDLDLQEMSENAVKIGLDYANKKLEESKKNKGDTSIKRFIPIVDMICLSSNISGLDNYSARRIRRVRDKYIDTKSPTVAIVSLLAGNQQLLNIANKTTELKTALESKTEVQTAMITLENGTGRILTMVGGRKYDNKFNSAVFNRATMAQIQPGSCIKPLYYSAGISSRLITPATIFNDSPVVFFEKGSDPYIPNNYMDKWQGPVRVRYALKRSMNIPSIKIFDKIGYDLGIDRISNLLGMHDKKNDQNYFPRKLPIALGIIRVAPVNMARAFATFANNGVASKPHGIMAIKDRNGNPLPGYANYGMNLEREVTDNREKYRILSPEEAYIMVSMLQSTVYDWGTLYIRARDHDFFDDMPMAGKTGTTQNWEDAWTVGFSPYMTSAVWFGFDEGNQSLGINLSGAALAGRTWSDFMSNAHKDKQIREFYKPENGIVERKICKKTGKLARSSCKSTMTEYFLDGTEPHVFCKSCALEEQNSKEEISKIHNHLILQNSSTAGSTDTELRSIEDILKDLMSENSEDFPLQNEENSKTNTEGDDNETPLWDSNDDDDSIFN